MAEGGDSGEARHGFRRLIKFWDAELVLNLVVERIRLKGSLLGIDGVVGVVHGGVVGVCGAGV